MTVSSTGASATIETINQSPPPPTIDVTFPEIPTWAKDALLPNVGKQADVVYDETGTPPQTQKTVTLVTVRAS